ncbi:unnamed protein product [Calicophoron daubneyi]|uniref:Secreted protein n=1 Tax=Calicophoron daubneyi TaxID=300641 RepID=A0AAV2TA86_CALDB
MLSPILFLLFINEDFSQSIYALADDAILRRYFFKSARCTSHYIGGGRICVCSVSVRTQHICQRRFSEFVFFSAEKTWIFPLSPRSDIYPLILTLILSLLLRLPDYASRVFHLPQIRLVRTMCVWDNQKDWFSFASASFLHLTSPSLFVIRKAVDRTCI